MSPDLKIALYALLNSALITAGVACQKMNGLRQGNPVYGPWIIAAFLCLAPTFFLGNLAMMTGGRMAIFAAMGAVTFLLVGAVSWAVFGEPLTAPQMGGLAAICAGVVLVAFGGNPAPAAQGAPGAGVAIEAPAAPEAR